MKYSFSNSYKRLSIEEHKAIQLGIMKYVAKFCESHNLQYFLSDGTLLGAVRHKGFIPWDDDIDIQMPRPDRNKLIELFNVESQGTNYYLIQPKDPIAQHYMVKIIDVRTVKLEPYLDYSRGFLGVDIDVFELNGCPEDEKEFEEWALQIRAYHKAYLYKKRNAWRTILGMGKDIIKGRLKAKFVPFMSSTEIIDKVNALFDKYPYGNSAYVCRIGIGDNFRLVKNVFDGYKLLRFEDAYYRVPKDYDAYLKSQYGDYMELPPEEKRVTHHVNEIYLKLGN